MNAGSLYAAGRVRITELVGDLPPRDLERPVPATPNWTAKDLVGHLAGVAADVTAGRIEGAGAPPWTARQVDERRPRPIGQVLDEWTALAPSVETMLSGAPPPVANRLICDVACHEHDLRGALERPGARDSDTVDQALQAAVGYLDSRLHKGGCRGLRLQAAETEWFVGPDQPGVSLTAEPFELFRLLFGRRSRRQMAAFRWTGDPSPYLDHLALFEPPVADLDE
jgi:uncharacterized protein (TIGR03083 family)